MTENRKQALKVRLQMLARANVWSFYMGKLYITALVVVMTCVCKLQYTILNLH